MEITLIILAYIASVFLNRWLNYIIYKRCKEPIIPFLWLFSLVTTFSLLIILISETKSISWFTGKHWK